MDQTCDGMHMPSHDRGGSGPNLRPPCTNMLMTINNQSKSKRRDADDVAIVIIYNRYLTHLIITFLEVIEKKQKNCKFYSRLFKARKWSYSFLRFYQNVDNFVYQNVDISVLSKCRLLFYQNVDISLKIYKSPNLCLSE